MLYEIKNVTYTYKKGTPFETLAIKAISFEIKEGEFLGIIGRTGSGKSTLALLLSGLIRPTSGVILFRGEELYSYLKERKGKENPAGILFQYPETCLFAETVYEDVAFGLRQTGYSLEDTDVRVHAALSLVGMDSHDILFSSPFKLSTGQMRRVSIAGVIAFEPQVLILDEPSAGLDPAGRREIHSYLRRIRDERGITIILISHDMTEVMELTERIIILADGECVINGYTKDILMQSDIMKNLGLEIPQSSRLLSALSECGYKVRKDIHSIEDITEEILKALQHR